MSNYPTYLSLLGDEPLTLGNHVRPADMLLLTGEEYPATGTLLQLGRVQYVVTGHSSDWVLVQQVRS